jgi:hypothetical protein
MGKLGILLPTTSRQKWVYEDEVIRNVSVNLMGNFVVTGFYERA